MPLSKTEMRPIVILVLVSAEFDDDNEADTIGFPDRIRHSMEVCRCCQGSALVQGFAMEIPEESKPDIHSEEFLRSLMRRQLRLSVACAATFLTALLGLPLLNYFLPDLMATRLFGFTLTWFLLGVLFFPFVWIIAYAFIKRSISLEQAEVQEVSRDEAKGAKGLQ